MEKKSFGCCRRLWAWLHEHEFVLLVILGLLILRIPNLFEPYWYGDEGIYLTVGQGMRNGSELYAEIMDHKTPMIYWMAYVVQTLLGLKVLLVIMSVISVTLFYLLALKVLKHKWAVRVATIAFALLTTLPRFEGNIANGELLLMPFVLAAMLIFFWDAPNKIIKKNVGAWLEKLSNAPAFMIGFFFSLAVLLKVPAGFDFAALCVFIVLFIPGLWQKKNLPLIIKNGLALVLGFIFPILLSIVYFAWRGTLSSYIDFGLLYNFRYVSLWSLPFTHSVTLFLFSLKGRLLVVMLLVSLVYMLGKYLTPRNQFVLVWAIFSAFAALLSLRPYPHYFMQIMPAVSLMIGALVTEKLVMRGLSVLLIGLLWFVLELLGFQPYPTRAYYENYVDFIRNEKSVDEYFMWFDQKTPDTYEMAKWLKTHTKPHERIFIWGNEPMVYSLANRTPVGRFVVDFHIESIDAYDEVYDDLVVSRPEYILDYIRDPSSFEQLYEQLSEYYVVFKRTERANVYRLIGGN